MPGNHYPTHGVILKDILSCVISLVTRKLDIHPLIPMYYLLKATPQSFKERESLRQVLVTGLLLVACVGMVTARVCGWGTDTFCYTPDGS